MKQKISEIRLEPRIYQKRALNVEFLDVVIDRQSLYERLKEPDLPQGRHSLTCLWRPGLWLCVDAI